MRVAMYYANDDVRLEQRPAPSAGPGEIVVRIESSGICGSDVMEWYRIHRVPLVLGHEIAGLVIETGRGVRGFKRGDRVVVAHHVPCGKCRYCRAGHETVCDTLRATNFDPGGFCESVRVPRINVEKGTFRIPRSVTFDEATFVEPLACVLRGQRLAGIGRRRLDREKTVLVLGSGMSGLLHIRAAKAAGVRRVIATDVHRYRLSAAKRSGADIALNGGALSADALKKINDGRLADLVIICASATGVFAQALRSVERGGTVLFFAAAGKGAAVELAINDLFWRNEVTLVSSYAGSPQDHRDALAMIASKRIDCAAMISHTFGLADTVKGFALVAGAGASMKVVIHPQR